MVQIYGKVTYGPFPVAYSSSTNCSEGCLLLDYCILSWKTPNGSCYHYSYLDRSDTIKVVEIGKEENSIVAFKTIITGTSCPISYTDMDFKVTISNGDTYSWKKFGNSWSLNGCRDGWKRFQRTDGISVCMKTFLARIDRYDARVNRCQSMGTDQIGVASVEESRWIYEQMMQYNPTTKTSFAFWTDGSFTENCKSVNFCEKFTWKDGYTTGIAVLNTSTNFHCKFGSNYCLIVAYFPGNTTKTMTSASCNGWGDGYVCGYNLKKSV